MFKNYFKKVIFISVLVVFISVLLVLICFQTSSSQPSNLKDRFSVGMVGWLLDPLYTRVETHHHDGWFNQLGFDLHLSYTQRNDSTNAYFGGFYDPLSKYFSNVNETIEYDKPVGNFKIFERAKIVRPAYGQRSTYQAEQNAESA
jgi:hypothetical protein